MSDLIIPGIEPVAITLGPSHLTEYGRALFGIDDPDLILPSSQFIRELKLASDSDYAENKILGHKWGKASWTMPATVALALCTVIPTDTSTGATITEPTYTGYARKVIAAAALSSPSGGEIKNAESLVFAECTAGSSTVVGAAVCDSSTKGAGEVITWMTVTSTVISTTATPPSVAANALVGTQD